jgi:TRAP-type transport system small permease protein
MNKVIGFVDRLNLIIFNILALIFGLVTLLTIYQVFARYVLNSPLVWSEEVIRYSMIWIVLLGTAVAIRQGLMVSVEIVLHIVPKKIRKVMEVIIVVLNIVFLIILIRYGLILVGATSGQNVGALDLPISIIYYAAPVAGVLGIINVLAVLVEIFTKKDDEEDKTDGSALI